MSFFLVTELLLLEQPQPRHTSQAWLWARPKDLLATKYTKGGG